MAKYLLVSRIGTVGASDVSESSTDSSDLSTLGPPSEPTTLAWSRFVEKVQTGAYMPESPALEKHLGPVGAIS